MNEDTENALAALLNKRDVWWALAGLAVGMLGLVKALRS